METETLISQAETARKLARCLVYGDAAIDDLVQEATLAALSIPPTRVRNKQAWIRGVTRNLARGQARGAARRQRRERAAARGEATRDPNALLACLDEHAAVLRRVKGLPTPYRAAITLRYLHDLTPTQVAEQLSLPIGTVKSQLKRGLTQLRDELDQTHGGDRRAWTTLLLALPRQTVQTVPGATGTAAAVAIGAVTLGGVAVKKMIWSAVAAILLLGTAMWIVDPFDLRDDDNDASGDPVLLASGDASPDNLPAAPATLQGKATADTPSPANAPDLRPAATDTRARITGRVVDAKGTPVRDALVWIDKATPRMDTLSVDELGRFSLAAKPGDHIVCARAPKTATTRHPILVPADGTVTTEDLVLSDGGIIRGKVVDAHGKPMAFMRVRCWAENAAHATEIGRAGTRYLIGGDDVATKADGLFVLRGLDREKHRVFVDLNLAPHFRAVIPSFDGIEPDGASLTFRIVPKHTVSGQVVDAATGRPVTFFRVGHRTFRDSEGRFEFALDSRRPLLVAALGYVQRTQTLALVDGEDARGLRIVLDPDPDTGTLRVEARATNEAGVEEPVAGWRVTVTDTSWNQWRVVCADSTGVLRIEGLSKGKQTLRFDGDGFAIHLMELTVEAGVESSHAVVLRRGGAVNVQLQVESRSGRTYRTMQVIDESGTSVPWLFEYDEPLGTSVVLTHEASGGPPKRIVMRSGTLTGVPAGTYVLRLAHDKQVEDLTLVVPYQGTTNLTRAPTKKPK